MGLLKHLLFWPVTGPQFLIEFSLGKVNDTVREQLTDDQLVKEDLLRFKYSGPWPPYNFVNIKLKLEKATG